MCYKFSSKISRREVHGIGGNKNRLLVIIYTAALIVSTSRSYEPLVLVGWLYKVNLQITFFLLAEHSFILFPYVLKVNAK